MATHDKSNPDSALPRAGSAPAKRRLTPVTAVFLIILVDVLGYTIILPLLPFYAGRFGASPVVIGTLLATFALCQLISGPFLGRWSDRIGRKPLLLLSQMGTLVGFLTLAFAPNLFFVFVGRILDGLTAGNISLAQATISDVTTPENRAKAFSRIGIAFGVGFLIGPAVSGYLSQYGYTVPILAGACLSATSIMATIFLLPQVKREPPVGAGAPMRIFDVASFGRFFRMADLRNYLLQFFLFMISFAMYTSGIALFASRRLLMDGKFFGPSEVAYLLAYGGLLGIILQGFIMGRLVQRFGERRLVTAGFVAMAIGYTVLSTASDLRLALLAVTFSSFGHGILRPSLTSLITKTVGRSEQGAVLGVNQSMQATGQIIAPLIGGTLINANLTSTWALVAAFFALAGLTVQMLRASPSAVTPAG